MIDLRTGLPGNGKSAFAIAELAAIQAQWDKGGDEARPVFVHNVKALALPHSPLPVIETMNAKTNTMKRVPDWSQVPDGSLVIVDEAQDLFPPRSSQSEAPPHVAWLNTHRHHGIDIIVITQHPKLIDGAVRALVGKHKHYRRVFGSSKVIVYEWDGCSDNLAGMKNATKSYPTLPKDVFKFYKSAEVHTKQKFKYPLWIVVPFIGLALMLVFVPKAITSVKDFAGGKTSHVQADKKADSLPSAGSAGQIGANGTEPDMGRPVAPKAAEDARVVAASVSYVGCISNDQKVTCLTSDGKTVNDPEGGREASELVGKLVRLHLAPTSSSVTSEQVALSEVRPVAVLDADGYGVNGKKGAGVGQRPYDGVPLAVVSPAGDDQQRPRVPAGSRWKAP